MFMEKIDFDIHGWDHTPLVRAGHFQVEPPTLRDNTGLADRLVRAAAKTWNLAEVTWPLGLVGTLPAWYQQAEYSFWVAVHVDGDRGRIVALEPVGRPPDTVSPVWGLAVDMGSTTLVLALVHMQRPDIVDQITVTNPQVEFGTDILTRVHYADRPEGLTTMVSLMRNGINKAVADLCRKNSLKPEQILAVSLAGNTTMTHFLLGLPVRTIIREPYVPVINRPLALTAADLGLNVCPAAPVLVMPNRGSYFGGDLLAGLLVSGIMRADDPCFLVDVGTNAEVVLGQRDWLIGAAGAAGPALEGGVAARGMVAGPGAIDHVRIDRNTKALIWRTIDNQPPRGLCGSGLIDLLAELWLSGLIDFQGRLTLPPGAPGRAETDEGPAYVVVPAEAAEGGHPILLTEIEIDILIRSKAAMYTILSTVIKSVGLSFRQIDRFFVAGTFGQYIDPRMAVAIGMVPDLPLDRFITLGNSSLKGAILTLISAEARAQVLEAWQKLTYLEMNVNQDLMNRFSAARFIPHTDRRLFPSVGTVIK